MEVVRSLVSEMAPAELEAMMVPPLPAVEEVRIRPRVRPEESEAEMETGPEEPVALRVTTCDGAGDDVAKVRLMPEVEDEPLDASASIDELEMKVKEPPVTIPLAVPEPVSEA